MANYIQATFKLIGQGSLHLCHWRRSASFDSPFVFQALASGAIGSVRLKPLTLGEKSVFWGGKVAFGLLFVAAPLAFSRHSWPLLAGAWLLSEFVTGWMLAFLFQVRVPAGRPATWVLLGLHGPARQCRASDSTCVMPCSGCTHCVLTTCHTAQQQGDQNIDKDTAGSTLFAEMAHVVPRRWHMWWMTSRTCRRTAARRRCPRAGPRRRRPPRRTSATAPFFGRTSAAASTTRCCFGVSASAASHPHSASHPAASAPAGRIQFRPRPVRLRGLPCSCSRT